MKKKQPKAGRPGIYIHLWKKESDKCLEEVRNRANEIFLSGEWTQSYDLKICKMLRDAMVEGAELMMKNLSKYTEELRETKK